MELRLEIPDQTHEREYGRVMDQWETMEERIQPELLSRGNIPYEKWLE